VAGESEADEQRFARLVEGLERRSVYNRRGEFVGMRNPTRPATLAGLAVTVVLLVLMLTVGDVQVGRWPLAERLLAWTLVTFGVSLGVGLVVLLFSRRRPRVLRWAVRLLSAAFATFIALGLVVALHQLLPLHLEGVLRTSGQA